MTRVKTMLITVVFPMLCTACEAQKSVTAHTQQAEDDSQRAAAAIADMNWLAGRWVGEGLGGTCEEMWTAPMAGHMLGTFRLVKDDQLNFSEFFMLSEDAGSLVLRLKHFGADLHGWEAKDEYVTFRLIRIEGKTAWFDGLTYSLDENGVLHAYVAIRQKDGEVSEGVFRYTRAP